MVTNHSKVGLRIGARVHGGLHQPPQPLVVGHDSLLHHGPLDAVGMAGMIQMSQMNKHYVRLVVAQDIAGAAHHHMVHKGLLGAPELVQVTVDHRPGGFIVGGGSLEDRPRVLVHVLGPNLWHQVIHIGASAHAGPPHSCRGQPGALGSVQAGFHLQILVIPEPVRCGVAHIQLFIVEDTVPVRRSAGNNGSMGRVGKGRINAAHPIPAVCRTVQQLLEVGQRAQKIHILVKERING